MAAKAATRALTKRDADALRYTGDGNERCVRWDAEVPGFGLRVYPSGRKSFIYSYRTRGGRSRVLTIGAYGVWTVQQARDKAREAAVQVKGGGDPLAERQQARGGDTVREFAEEFLQRYTGRRRALKPRTRKEYKRKLDLHVIPLIGSMKLAEVKRADVARIRTRLSDRPVEANRTIEVVRRLFNVASEWGRLPEGAPNPAAGLETFAEVERERFVRDDELPRLLAAIEAEESIYARAAIRLLLLTGCRRGEVLGLRWTDVSLERAEFRLGDTKSGKPRTVPLSPPAVELLRNLPRTAGNPYVFPGQRRGKPLVNLSKPWDRIRTAAKLEDVTIHDLRRTVGAHLATSGVSTAIVGAVLGHSSPAATKIYARIADSAPRAALEGHALKLQVVNDNGRKGPTLEDRLRELLTGGDRVDLAERLRALAAELETGA